MQHTAPSLAEGFLQEVGKSQLCCSLQLTLQLAVVGYDAIKPLPNPVTNDSHFYIFFALLSNKVLSWFSKY